MSKPKIPEVHVFICTNKRSGGDYCAGLESEELRKELKEDLKSCGKKVRVNTSGCLGQCEHGIVAVIYPQAEWFFGLKNNKQSRQLLAAKVEAYLSSTAEADGPVAG